MSAIVCFPQPTHALGVVPPRHHEVAVPPSEAAARGSRSEARSAAPPFVPSYHQTSGAAPTLPPLSDAFMRLASLKEHERLNLRLLEMIAWKDPAAVARLLALSNSPLVSAGRRKVTTLAETLSLLGTTRACDALMAIWATGSLSADAGSAALRDFLVRHIFAVCTTMRRVVAFAGLDDDVGTLDLQLFALVDKLALAPLLSEAVDHPARCALMQAAKGDHHRLHRVEALDGAFALAPALAEAWQLDEALLEQLVAMSHWKSLPQQPVLVASMLLAEALCDAHGKANPRELAQALYPQCWVMRRLVDRRIDPLSLALKF